MTTDDGTELDIRHGDSPAPATEALAEEPAADLPPDTDIAVAEAVPASVAAPPTAIASKEQNYPLPTPEVGQMAPPPPPAD